MNTFMYNYAMSVYNLVYFLLKMPELFYKNKNISYKKYTNFFIFIGQTLSVNSSETNNLCQ